MNMKEWNKKIDVLEVVIEHLTSKVEELEKKKRKKKAKG